MAGLIPPEIIEEIMQRADIVEIIGEYVALKKRGRNWFGLCPFHHEDTPSFSVNDDKQIFKCFGCGEGGNVIGFIQKKEHLTFGEAARKLAERYNITIPERAMSPAEQERHAERQSMLTAHAQAAGLYHQLLPDSHTALAYIKKRGIAPEMVERFSLGAAPEDDWQALYEHLRKQGFGDEGLIKCGLVSRSAKNGRCYDKFHGRLIFPIRDQRGAVVAFGGRAMGEDEPKYLNSQTTPIYNKSNLLYALDLAGESIRRSGQVIVMEGYMDVLTAHQYGVDNAVACLGTAFTPEHARLLSRYAPAPPARLQVVLSFDGDAAGAKAALASLDKLQGLDFIEPRVLIYPEKLDPDEFLRKYGLPGWKRLLEKYCYSLLDYLLLRALQGRDVSTAADKGAIVRELAPALQRTGSSTERDDFIRQLARRLQVNEDSIYADLRISERTTAPRPAPAPSYREPQFRPGRKSNRQLLLQALSDRELFSRACAELGDDFASTDEEAQLIAFVRQLGDGYDFLPRSLFNHLGEQNAGLRDFLLKLLQENVAQGDSDDVIRSIKRRLTEEKLAALQRKISQAEYDNQDVTELIREKMRLSRDLKNVNE